MILKRYRCKRFAGLKDKNVEFHDGINVLLGDNESGKSTLIEGIYAVMFKPTKIGRKSVDDKQFLYKFMPIPGGDSIDGELVISNQRGDYELRKEWGASPAAELVAPGVEKIKSEDKINEILKEVLIFGEGTFSNILFTKQQHIKEAMEKIIASKETTTEIGTLLRKAIMELDGISIDELGLKIDAEIDRLLKRWDVDRTYPENNKGINNPYKTGIGEVVEYFYRKERIRLSMEEAQAKEKHFDEIGSQLKELESSLSARKTDKEAMEKLEGDVIKRARLEPTIAQYEKEQAALMKINQQWPQHEMRLQQLEAELGKLAGEYGQLEKEKERAVNARDKEALLKNLSKVDEIQQKILATDEKIKTIRNVTKEDIQALDENNQGVLTTEAKMNAGVMIGKLTHYAGASDLIITRDLDEPISIKAGDTFQANGYLKIEFEKLLGLELKSGDIDFADLRIQHAQYKKNMESLLLALGVRNIEEAKLNKEKLDELSRDQGEYQKQIKGLLGDQTYAALKTKIAEYGDLSQVMSIPAIESEIKTMDGKKIDSLSEQKSVQGVVAEWYKKYKDPNELLDRIITLKMAQKSDAELLAKLAPLPAGCENADMFSSDLADLRKAYEKDQGALSKLKEEYYDCEKNLPESTYEELAAEYKMVEERFEQKLAKGKNLLKIKKAFESTRARIDANSFAPLAQAFSKYIVLLTKGSFVAGDIDNSFQLKLEKDKETDIPIELLSTGTYDAVALALRLAILEYILGDTKGFMILDDCLVDLDPDRKAIAVQLIQNFASQHQVIFCTCSPDTARLLGGHVIQM